MTFTLHGDGTIWIGPNSVSSVKHGPADMIAMADLIAIVEPSLQLALDTRGTNIFHMLAPNAVPQGPQSTRMVYLNFEMGDAGVGEVLSHDLNGQVTGYVSVVCNWR